MQVIKAVKLNGSSVLYMLEVRYRILKDIWMVSRLSVTADMPDNYYYKHYQVCNSFNNFFSIVFFAF